MTARALKLPLDHVGVAGRDIGAMVAAYAKLRFHITPQQPLLGRNENGELVPLGQTSAHIMFPDTYIELTAVEAAARGNHLAPYLARYEGVQILALAAGTAETCRATLKAAGIKTSAVAEAARDVVYGTPGLARFKWFVVDSEIFEEGLVCCVEHETPEVVFQKEVMTHPNGAIGLSAVFVCPANLGNGLRIYDKLSIALPQTHDVWLWDDKTRDELSFPFKQLPTPCLQGFAIKVQSLEELRGLLSRNDVPLAYDANAVWATPHHAAGALLKFHE